MMNYGSNWRAPKVDVHAFSMVPRADIPRSSFRMQFQHKSTFSASNLIPMFCQEVLPGDSWAVNLTAFCRLATPLYPIMDNMDLESWFFFVPNRLTWINWYRFMGEQENPSDSISFSIPQVVSPVGGFAQFSLYDYFGLPCVGQVAGGNTVSVSALPFRAYQVIWNQWFRDQNLQNGAVYGSLGSTGIQNMDNGPDPSANYILRQVNKRHDYFTAALPWTQKGAAAVTLPLGTSATVRTNASDLITGAQGPMRMRQQTSGTLPTAGHAMGFSGATGQVWETTGPVPGSNVDALYPANLYADLSTATAATINAIRLAFQTQRLLERDARGGTRYTEIIRSHFGVMSPDMRLQRPEYLGGGKTPVNIAPVPQTTATGLTGGATPLGTLSGVGTSLARGHGFRQSFTEHGYIIGLCAVRQDQGYQQGIPRHWSRLTRYDFYFPVFSMLGEKAVYNREIYADGSANDGLVFGFQENWAEYRYLPSYTSGYFRSTTTTPIDAWHLQVKFASLPVLNGAFMEDNTTTNLQRALAAGAAAGNQQLLADLFFDCRVARPMPVYSVPGMVDHF